jgi:hypothetical protein
MTGKNEKQCSNCSVYKPVSDFYKRTDGNLHNQCKTCILKKQSEKHAKMKTLKSIQRTCSGCAESKLLIEFIEMPNNTYHEVCKTCCADKVFLCIGCSKVLPKEQFWLRYDTKKPRGECKQCTLKRKSKWREDNNEHYKAQASEYRSRPEVRSKALDYQKAYYRKPGVKERKLLLARVNDKYKYHNNEDFKMKKVLRARVTALVNQVRTDGHASAIGLLGCDFQSFKRWIEYQFDANMTWENHGEYWHLDHIKPCASFDLTNEEDIKICFNWINYRPLEKMENIKKSDKYDDHIAFKAELMLSSFIITQKILDHTR